jgi:hypothetical protein
MQDWKTKDKISGSENAELEIDGQKFTMWKTQDKNFSSETAD